MGLFDFIKGGGIKKHASRVANKHAQAPDRWEAIQALKANGTSEAVQALLVRFTFRCDPGITDQEEKDAAYRAIVEIGGRDDARDETLALLRQAMRTQDSIAWPLKCLGELLSDENAVVELLSLLDTMDTDYERDPAKKIQAIGGLEERTDPRIVEGVVRFLSDMNEDVRFHAAATLLRQSEADRVSGLLVDRCLAEESVRIRAAILDGFIELGWSVGDKRDELLSKLPDGYAIDPKGNVRRR